MDNANPNWKWYPNWGSCVLLLSREQSWRENRHLMAEIKTTQFLEALQTVDRCILVIETILREGAGMYAVKMTKLDLFTQETSSAVWKHREDTAWSSVIKVILKKYNL